MSLDVNALTIWIVVTIIFITVIGFLYGKVTRSKPKPESDECRDEAPSY